MWFTYVILCDNGALYKGHTNNLEKRYNQHCMGKGAKYTQIHKPVRLLYFEEFATLKEAIEREKFFKTGIGREKLNKILKEKELL